ncbi:MAG: AAA family ATPase [Desulfoplanes sp.]
MQTTIPFIPATLWLLAAALTVAVLLIFFFLHFYWRKRQYAYLQDGSDAADMAAHREQLGADVTALRDWMEQQKNELLRLTSEREELERVRNELSDLEQRCLVKDQENEALRREVGELENRKYMATQTLEQLENRIGDIETNRSQAEALKREIENMEAQLDESRKILTKISETEIRLNALTREKENLEEGVQKLKEDFDSKNFALSEIRSELQNVEPELEDLRESRKERAQLVVLVDALRSEQNALEREVARLEDLVSSLNEKSRVLEDTVAEKQSIYEDIMNQLSIKEDALGGMQDVVQDLEDRKDMAAQTLKQFQDRIGDIESNQRQAEALKREIENLEAQLVEAREILAKVPEAEIRLNALAREKENLEERIQKLKENFDSENVVLAEIRSELKNVEPELEDLRESRKERAQLEVLVGSLRSEQTAIERDVSRIEEMLSSLSEKSSTLVEKVNEKQSTYEEVKNQLSIKREELDRTQEVVQKLEIRKDRLESEVEKLTRPGSGRNGEDTRERYADLLVRDANSLLQHEFTSQTVNEDEYGALETFKGELQQRGIHFPDRVVDAFHTSLKCQSINPLTVLAGVSGTGKTLLPMKYAEFMGLHSLVIPVQPRWDSPQDLFGFYNYLEKEYKATELSRALVRMDKYNYPDSEYGAKYAWPRKRLLMVLLDEMNLARTEYYFSEFLSKLELRRQVKHPDDLAQRVKAEVELDTGPGLQNSFRIWVPENVLFVGTMNEDETTQTLSDKVLDRSNVLRFGKPDERQDIQTNASLRNKQRPYLSYEKWKSWQRDSRTNDSWWSETSRWIRSINDGLDRVGRPFGFRVEDAIHLYLANYPRVNSDDRYKLAFADQIEQKIIPKLRGLDITDPNTTVCLGEVETVIGVLGDGALARTFNTAKEESRNLGMFTWRGVTRS